MKVENQSVEVKINYESLEANKKVNEKTSDIPKEVVNETATNDKKAPNVEEAVNKINKHLEATNTRIKFKIHDSSHSLNNKVSIKVIDEENEKVIAEIPSEEIIEFSEKMHEIIGVLFDKAK